MKHHNKLFYIQEALYEKWNCETCKYSEKGLQYNFKCLFPKRIIIVNDICKSHEKE